MSLTARSPESPRSGSIARYVEPALTLLGACALFVACVLIPDEAAQMILFFASPIFYFGGTIWWARRAAALDAHLWPDGLLALLPIAPSAVIAKVMVDSNDESAFFAAPLLMVIIAICLVPPFCLAIRKWAERLNRGASSD